MQYGGMPGCLDLGSIESAIARPYVTFDGRPRYPRIFQKAAALVQSLVKNHGFVDGNKRTALISLNTFLLRSGYALAASVTDDDVESMILGTAESRIGYAGLVAWFKTRIMPRAE